jgi:hypothetical protein
MSATNEVENSISIIATFPSSLLKIFANGSVWYIWKPRDVPWALVLESMPTPRNRDVKLTNCQAAVVLVKGHKVHGHDGAIAARNTVQQPVVGEV